MSSDSCVKYLCALVAAVVLIIVASAVWGNYYSAQTSSFAMKYAKNRVKAPGAAVKREGLANGSPSLGVDTSDITPLAGVDQSVIDSHRQFVGEAYNLSSGANTGDTVRDDTNEVNKRWGLRRVDYTSAYSSDSSRQVSSEDPHQMAQSPGTMLL